MASLTGSFPGIQFSRLASKVTSALYNASPNGRLAWISSTQVGAAHAFLFDDESLDAIYASHTLEDITDYVGSIRDRFRLLRQGGCFVIVAPH
jgi:hypothetical protein